MNVEIFTLCDEARLEPDNMMTIIRSYDALFFPGFPGMLRITIAIKLRFHPHESGHHILALEIGDANLRPVAPLLERAIEIKDGFEQSQPFHLVWDVRDVAVQAQGNYTLRLLMDGEGLSHIPIFVRLRQ